MNIHDVFDGMWERGVTFRRFPGGERPMVHRWPKKRMRGVDKSIRDLWVDNICANNELLKRLQKRA